VQGKKVPSCKGGMTMTFVEQAGFKLLCDFIGNAEEHGICYNGEDMPLELQQMVINIVKDYAEKYKEEVD